MKRITLSFVAIILFASTRVALASTFIVDSASALDLSGNVSASFPFPNLGVISGSAPVVQQGNGSLHANLTGFLNADGNGNTLSFPGGSNIVAQPSGNWNPQKAPAAFGFEVSLPLSTAGPQSLNLGTLRLIADVRNLSFDVTGSVLLSGPAGNQTFDPAGLALIAKTGTLDVQGFFCAPGETDLAQCADLGTKSSPPDDISTPDILPHGTGTLTGPSFARSLLLPISLTATDSLTDTQPLDIGGNTVNVTITVDQTFTLAGSFIASIPEPSDWSAMCIGLAGLAVALRRTRRRRS